MSHIELSVLLHAPPARVYRAWLRSAELGIFMGHPALVEPWPDGKFLIRGGHVEGHIFDLKPSWQIVQTWRTPDLPLRCADSLVALILEPFGSMASRLTVEHVQIPADLVVAYERAWREDYLESMQRHFAGSAYRPVPIEIPAFQTA